MSDLELIKAKIAATEAKLKKAEDEERPVEYLISIQNTLAKQQEEKNLLLAQSVPAPVSYRTPTPTAAPKSPHRDSTKQKGMRQKVMERNRQFYFPAGEDEGWFACDICFEKTNKPSDYINSHIIAHAHSKRLKEAKPRDGLVVSPSYVDNGLFLCRGCDKHFEDHYIRISGDGTLMVDPSTTPKVKYSKLHGTKVMWADKINVSREWPTSQTLEFRNTLFPVCGEHRARLDYGVEDDDHSLASDYDEETPLLPPIRQLKSASKSGAGVGKDRNSLVALLKKAGVGAKDAKQLLNGKNIVTRIKTKPRGEKWEDWEEIEFEGCHAWINKETNEISEYGSLLSDDMHNPYASRPYKAGGAFANQRRMSNDGVGWITSVDTSQCVCDADLLITVRNRLSTHLSNNVKFT